MCLCLACDRSRAWLALASLSGLAEILGGQPACTVDNNGLCYCIIPSADEGKETEKEQFCCLIWISKYDEHFHIRVMV